MKDTNISYEISSKQHIETNTIKEKQISNLLEFCMRNGKLVQKCVRATN